MARAWWDAMPRQELALLAETVQRVLDGSDDQPIIDNRDNLRAALDRVKTHRTRRTDRIDRREINRRLRQYARGDREWLFCETIGG